VDVPLALLNLSTISCASGESVMVVLREVTVWRRTLATLPLREVLRIAAEDGILVLITLI
jgi:hypothetical protein